MTNDLQPKRTVYSVTELNRTIRNLLESEFPLLWIEGEISNLAQPASGHIYLTLKDAGAQVRCAMFKGRKQFLRFKPQNGQKVLVRAKVGLYEARGDYQLIIEHMEEAGAGDLQRQFEELKERLAKEGLFDEAVKQLLPELPERIGIITSATGAAIRDVLSVLERRFPSIPVRVYPVAVQGEAAAGEICRALKRASKRKDCDVLLLVRGGGSLEDLWSFNEESVARAIYDCDIPVVCGVGHEVDFTIADFVADVRAPTPSAAAELITPDQQTYIDSFGWYRQRLQQIISEKIRYQSEQLGWLRKRLYQQHPVSRLEQHSQRLDDLQQRLSLAWHHLANNQWNRVQLLQHRLMNASPIQEIDYGKQRVAELSRRLSHELNNTIEKKQNRLASLSRTLHAVSPLQTLARGYAIVSDAQGVALTDSAQVEVGDEIGVRLDRGALVAEVKSKS